MTVQEIQKQNNSNHLLRVFCTPDDTFFVESEDGKSCYLVNYSDDLVNCTCNDFLHHIKSVPNYKCSHLMSVIAAIENGTVTVGDLVKPKQPKLDERFITNIKGKDFVLYAGLLDMGHQKNIQKIIVEPLQYPTKENGYEAICKATVISITGEEYTEIGDANPYNVNQMITRHILRMAATRAKARALRDYTNVGLTALEEIGDADNVIGDDAKPSKPNTSNKPAAKSNTREIAETNNTTPVKEQSKSQLCAATSASSDSSPIENVNSDVQLKLSNAQYRAITNLSRRRGISPDDLSQMSTDTYKVIPEDLSPKQAAEFIQTLQTSS